MYLSHALCDIHTLIFVDSARTVRIRLNGEVVKSAKEQSDLHSVHLNYTEYMLGKTLEESGKKFGFIQFTVSL